MVIGHGNVGNDKTNEILAFAIELLDFAGKIVTVDMTHNLRKAVRFVIGKGSHYYFGAKEHQPRLWNAALDAPGGIDL